MKRQKSCFHMESTPAREFGETAEDAPGCEKTEASRDGQWFHERIRLYYWSLWKLKSLERLSVLFSSMHPRLDPDCPLVRLPPSPPLQELTLPAPVCWVPRPAPPGLRPWTSSHPPVLPLPPRRPPPPHLPPPPKARWPRRRRKLRSAAPLQRGRSRS